MSADAARIRELMLANLFARMPDFVFSAAGPVQASTWLWCAMDGSPCCTRS